MVVLLDEKPVQYCSELIRSDLACNSSTTLPSLAKCHVSMQVELRERARELRENRDHPRQPGAKLSRLRIPSSGLSTTVACERKASIDKRPHRRYLKILKPLLAVPGECTAPWWWAPTSAACVHHYWQRVFFRPIPPSTALSVWIEQLRR